MKYYFLVFLALTWSYGDAFYFFGLNLFNSKKTDSDGFIKPSIISQFINDECVEPANICPNKNITFWYYTNLNPDDPIQLDVTHPSSLDFVESNPYPWKIIIHGYTKSKDEIPNPQLRSAYFQRGKYNVISVDYEPIARDKCYISSVKNVDVIANCTAQLINSLVDKGVFEVDKLHILGFSLGAQVAGRIHEYVPSGKPMRVTGLDPASPFFWDFLNKRLDTDAAGFVDVIHTNGLSRGKIRASGHVDFYVNGGLSQPGCLIEHNETFTICSHDRGPLYYAESINSQEGFWGIPCNSLFSFYAGLCQASEEELVIMGEDTPFSARGTYYLQTKSRPNFALGKATSVRLVN